MNESKQFKNPFKKKKSIAAAGLCFFSLAAAGIIAGTTAYTITKGKPGANFNGTIETTTYVSLDSFKTNTENLAVLKEISDKNIRNYEQIGFQEIKASYGVRTDSKKKTGSETIGYITYNFVPNSNNLSILSLIDGENTDERVRAKLQLLSVFANSNRVEIQNINQLLVKSEKKSELFKDNRFQTENKLLVNGNVEKNNVHSVTINADNRRNQRTQDQLSIDLKQFNGDLPLNLRDFDQEFRINLGYNPTEERTYEDVVRDFNGRPESKKVDPKQSYLIWFNRDALVNKLNLLTLLAFGFDQKNISVDEYNYLTLVYNGLNQDSEERAYIDWIKSNLSTFKYEDFYISSTDLNYNFDPKKDKLLKVISQFYKTDKHKVRDTSNPQGQNKVFKDYEMFYSWYIKDLSLINQYVRAIDYQTFFSYFPKKDKENKDYFADHLELKPDNLPTSAVDSLRLLAGSAFDFMLINPHFDVVNKNYAHYFKSVLDSTRGIKSTFNNGAISTTPLKTYEIVLIGLAVMILIVGIVVSILYKTGGAIFFLLSSTSFTSHLAIITSSGFGFSPQSYASIIASLFVGLFLFVNFNNTFKGYIRDNYSFKNAIEKAILKSLFNFTMMYLLLLFASLVFMYFGQYYHSTFGYNFIFGVFTNIIFCFLAFLLLSYTVGYVLSNKPKHYVSGIYLMKVNAINNNAFDFQPNFDEALGTSNSAYLLRVLKHKKALAATMIVILFIAIAGILLLSFLRPDSSYLFGSLFKGQIEFDVSKNELKPFKSIKSIIYNEPVTEIYFDPNKTSFNDDLNQLALLYRDGFVVLNSNPNGGTSIFYNALAIYSIIFAVNIIWSFIWFRNFYSLIANIVLLFSFFLSLGYPMLFRIDVNEYSPIALNVMSVVLLVYVNISSLSFNQKMMKVNSGIEHETTASKSLIEHLFNYNVIYILYVFTLLFGMIFLPLELVSFNGLIVVGFLFSYLPSILLIYLLSKTKFTRVHKENKVKLKLLNNKYLFSYDKYDEQPIVKINKF
ncbi:hypothetical protein [Ureaplasma canigenitalium]|uniref:hypothetical protein n=1 Tax=Ureaplasma canigenitalium TaxID=42092 RepID=UPI0004E11368|nr:hypothetical protein [Ureaplasma canigenitalium]